MRECVALNGRFMWDRVRLLERGVHIQKGSTSTAQNWVKTVATISMFSILMALNSSPCFRLYLSPYASLVLMIPMALCDIGEGMASGRRDDYLVRTSKGSTHLPEIPGSNEASCSWTTWSYCGIVLGPIHFCNILLCSLRSGPSCCITSVQPEYIL